MFEYLDVNMKRITINPKYIIAISEYGCNKGQCLIHTVNGSWIVNEDYEVVNKHYGNWLLGTI